MSQRKTREFLRLLDRTANLNDPDQVKMNVAVLDNKLSDLIRDNVFNENQEKEYSQKIHGLQAKITPKIEVNQSKREQLMNVNLTISKDDQDIAKERMKHDKITSDILDLSNQLKDRVSKVSVKVAEDEEVINTVHENMHSISDKALSTNKQMNITVSQRLGLTAYKYLAIVIIVYLIITIIL